MAVTEPANLAYPGRNADTPETAITNAAASEKGFPARTQEGNLVFIVKTEREGLQKVLTDADGNRYVDHGPTGSLIPFTTEELTDDEPSPLDYPANDDGAQAYADAVAQSAAEVQEAVADLDTQPLDNGDDLSSAA